MKRITNEQFAVLQFKSRGSGKKKSIGRLNMEAMLPGEHIIFDLTDFKNLSSVTSCVSTLNSITGVKAYSASTLADLSGVVVTRLV